TPPELVTALIATVSSAGRNAAGGAMLLMASNFCGGPAACWRMVFGVPPKVAPSSSRARVKYVCHAGRLESASGQPVAKTPGAGVAITPALIREPPPSPFATTVTTSG